MNQRLNFLFLQETLLRPVSMHFMRTGKLRIEMDIVIGTRTVCRWNDTNPARFWSIPSDPRLIFDPTTYVGVSSSCICLSIMVKLFNIDK